MTTDKRMIFWQCRNCDAENAFPLFKKIPDELSCEVCGCASNRGYIQNQKTIYWFNLFDQIRRRYQSIGRTTFLSIRKAGAILPIIFLVLSIVSVLSISVAAIAMGNIGQVTDSATRTLTRSYQRLVDDDDAIMQETVEVISERLSVIWDNVVSETFRLTENAENIEEYLDEDQLLLVDDGDADTMVEQEIEEIFNDDLDDTRSNVFKETFQLAEGNIRAQRERMERHHDERGSFGQLLGNLQMLFRIPLINTQSYLRVVYDWLASFW